jgi:hypothetical protein
MATAFTSFRPSSDFARTAVDTVLGAAGTRMAMRLLRRYPKTAIAIGVAAGASALLGGLLHRKSEQPQKRTQRRKSQTKSKPAAD